MIIMIITLSCSIYIHNIHTYIQRLFFSFLLSSSNSSRPVVVVVATAHKNYGPVPELLETDFSSVVFNVCGGGAGG